MNSITKSSCLHTDHPYFTKGAACLWHVRGVSIHHDRGNVACRNKAVLTQRLEVRVISSYRKFRCFYCPFVSGHRAIPCQFESFLLEIGSSRLTLCKRTAELAPPGYGRILSWFCGYFNTVGWCVVSASVTIIPGQFIMAMTIVYHPEIEYQRWHGFVIYQAFAIIFTLINIFRRKALPALNKFGLIFCIMSFFIVNMTVLGTAFPKNSATFVFDIRE